MGFELLTVVQWVFAALVGNIAAFFLIKLIALTREKHKEMSVGGIIPEEPKEQRPCYLTEQIRDAARAAGLCIDCGETREVCGGWYPDALTGSPSVPGWVCGTKNPHLVEKRQEKHHQKVLELWLMLNKEYSRRTRHF